MNIEIGLIIIDHFDSVVFAVDRVIVSRTVSQLFPFDLVTWTWS